MAPELVAFGIRLGVLMLALLAVRSAVFFPASISLLRQRLFGLRRKLFLLAADGHLAFNDPAYTRLRSTINNSLRFAERYTFPRMLLTWSLIRGAPDIFEDQRDDVTIVASVRQELEGIRLALGMAIAEHLMRTSLVAKAVAFCAPVVTRSRRIERSAEALSLADENRAAAA